MSQNIGTISNVVQAGAHWIAWGKIGGTINSLQTQETNYAKKAFLESISQMPIKNSTSVVTILNSGVATAAYHIAKEAGLDDDTNIKKRINNLTRKHAAPLLQFLRKLQVSDANNRASLVDKYVGTAAERTQHLVQQLGAFSAASIDELQHSLRVKGSNQSSLRSAPDCYLDAGDRAEWMAEEKEYKELKKKYTQDLKNTSTASSTLAVEPALAEHQQIHALYNLAASCSQTGHGNEEPFSMQDLASTISDSDAADSAGFETENCDSLPTSSNKRCRGDDNRSMSMSTSSSKRARLHFASDSATATASAQKLLHESLAKQQARLDADQAQLHRQQQHLAESQAQFKAERKKLDEDFKILRQKQRAFDGRVHAHEQRVSQDEKDWQEEARKFNAGVKAHEGRVALDLKEVEIRQRGFNTSMDKEHHHLNQRRKGYRQWEQHLWDQECALNLRERALDKRENDLNKRDDDVSYRPTKREQHEDIAHAGHASGAEDK